MDWIRVAFGLIREAAKTGPGQEVINNLRSTVRKDPPNPEQPAVNIEAYLTEYRNYVNRSLEAVVQTLNAQNEKLTEMHRRQRIWNIALTAGIILAVLIAFLK